MQQSFPVLAKGRIDNLLNGPSLRLEVQLCVGKKKGKKSILARTFVLIKKCTIKFNCLVYEMLFNLLMYSMTQLVQR